MKKSLILLLICLLALPALSIARKKYRSAEKDRHYYSHRHDQKNNVFKIIDDAYVSLDDEMIYIYSDYFDEEIEITEDNDLIIDGDKLELTEKQTQLVATFYSDAMDVREISEKMGDLGGHMGDIGGQMGTLGALIGQRAAIQAQVSLAAVLSDYYDDVDEDDYEEYEEAYEDYLDRLEDKLDAMDDRMEESEDKMDALSDRMDYLGDKMEALGDEMEDQADEMEDAFDDMVAGIPTLKELDW